jgi:hypothetical protein
MQKLKLFLAYYDCLQLIFFIYMDCSLFQNKTDKNMLATKNIIAIVLVVPNIFNKAF